MASIIIFIFYPTDSKLGNEFGLVVVLLIFRYAGLAAGVVLILLRGLSVLKTNSALIYIFTGSLNICLGVIGLVLFISNNMVSPVFNLFILNIITGAIIFIDVMVFNSK